MAEKTYTYVPAELKSAAIDGVVVSAEGVFDYDFGENGEKLSEINRRVAERLGLGNGPSSAYANNSKITLKNDSNVELGHFTLNLETPKTIQIPTPKNSEVRFHKGDSEEVFASFTLNKSTDTDIRLETPGNGTLKFKKNGIVFETFSANQSEDVEIDLTGASPGEDQVIKVLSDWNESNPNSLAYINNKPNLSLYITQSNLSDYATKSYVDDAIENLTPEGGGEENLFAFSNINVTNNDESSTIIEAGSKTDTFYLKAGNNITLTVEGNTIIISTTSSGGGGGGTPVETKTVYFGYLPNVPTASTISSLSHTLKTSIIGVYRATLTYETPSLFYFVIPVEWSIPYVLMNGFAFPMGETGNRITVNDKIYKIYVSTGSEGGYDLSTEQDRIEVEE